MILLNLHPRRDESFTHRRSPLHEAQEKVRVWHRHSCEVTGHRFSLAAIDRQDAVRGVAICGRPVAKSYDPERVLEILRVATDGAKNCCSFLYACCLRAARALGFFMVITYTLRTEDGASLRGAGFSGPFDSSDEGAEWSRPSRQRPQQGVMFDLPVREAVARYRWEVVL